MRTGADGGMRGELQAGAGYDVVESFEGGLGAAYHLTVPPTMTEVNLSTVRVTRDAGITAADVVFQAQLFHRIGAIVVSGGHVETGMKRLLLLLTGRPSGQFSLVDANWSDLHKKLLRQCNGLDSRRNALHEVLKWGEDHRVKQRRDNVVHAHWWVFAGVGVRANRFHRRQDGRAVLGTMEELDETSALLSEYASRLDDLLGEDWSRAILPRLPDSPPLYPPLPDPG